MASSQSHRIEVGCLTLIFLTFFAGCAPQSGNDRLLTTPQCLRSELRSIVSDRPGFVIKRYPLKSFQLDRKARFELGKSLVSYSWAKASPGVCIHMMRIRQYMVKENQEPEMFEDAFRKFETILFDDSAYRNANGGLSILVDTPYGARYRITPPPLSKNYEVASQLNAIAHRDQVLAKLFESARECNFSIKTPKSQSLTGIDILVDSLASFDMRNELEWTLMAYCGYLKSPVFDNCHGKTYYLIDLAECLFLQAESEGSCHGCHRLYALAVFLNWAEIERKSSNQEGRLKELVTRIHQYFQKSAVRLEKNQIEDGSWNSQWWKDGTTRDLVRLLDQNELSNRIRATSHLLEWSAITPPEFRPNERVLAKAVGFLSNKILPRPDHFAEKHLLETSHALSALFLLDPLEVNDDQ